MPSPEEIQPGITLRVIMSHGLGAPIGRIARVKAIETSFSGDWVCIVEYNDIGGQHGTRLYRSHLWISSLGRFEIVKDNAQQRKKRGAIRPSRTRIQLTLPFAEDNADY
jgi:hypothetical protein